MTDQPRGAYTPQPDAPLQFDARSPASRRPMPMALIASGALLVVLIAAVAMYYSRGVRGEGEPPRPVGEPVAVLKSAPAATAQPSDAAPGLDAAAAASGRAPVFAPTPEAPNARPAPAAPNRLTVQTLSAGDMNRAQAAETAAIKAPVGAGAAQTNPAQTNPAQTNVVKTSAVKPVAMAAATPAPELPTAETAAPAAHTSKVAVAKTSMDKTTIIKTGAAKPVTVKPAVAKVAASETTAASASGVRVQIGAFSSSALADKGYSDVAGLMPGAMGGHVKHVEPVDKDGSTLYRTSVTGFADRAAAASFCDALKAKGKICFVKS